MPDVPDPADFFNTEELEAANAWYVSLGDKRSDYPQSMAHAMMVIGFTDDVIENIYQKLRGAGVEPPELPLEYRIMVKMRSVDFRGNPVRNRIMMDLQFATALRDGLTQAIEQLSDKEPWQS